MVIDVDAMEAPVDAGVDKASIIHSLNLPRQALVDSQLTEEQSQQLRRLSLSTRCQTVGLWDCGTQLLFMAQLCRTLPGKRPPQTRNTRLVSGYQWLELRDMIDEQMQ